MKVAHLVLVAFAATLACVLARPADVRAQTLTQAFERLVDGPPPPFGTEVERILSDHAVGGLSLREYLSGLDFEGCMREAEEELTAGLDQLRVVHVTALENRRDTAVWRTWDRKLDQLSPDGMLLVQTWLDSPEVARRLYFCEDGLPASWRSLSPAGYTIEAVTWFDIAVAEREEVLRNGSPGDREQVVMELIEVRSALLDRFETTFAASSDSDEAMARLDGRLGLMWEALVEPHHFGFTPRPRADAPNASPDATRRTRVQGPSAGRAPPDPRDVALRDRVVSSWRRQREAIDAEIADRQARLDEAVAAIDASDDPRELDRLVRVASRLDAELAQAVSDMERLQSRVRLQATGRPWVDGMLSNGYRRRAVRRLRRRESKIQDQRERVEQAVEVAVAKGGRPPDQQRREGPPGSGSGSGVASRVPGQPGPGDWLAGLPMPSEGLPQTAIADVGIPEGAGWIERIYEGPLATPSQVWSDDLVEAIRTRHPALDDTDVRILLGLVREAYSELSSRAEVERAVWRSLASDQGLKIRGEESTLSELWAPGAARADQPIITFVLTLYF